MEKITKKIMLEALDYLGMRPISLIGRLKKSELMKIYKKRDKYIPVWELENLLNDLKLVPDRILSSNDKPNTVYLSFMCDLKDEQLAQLVTYNNLKFGKLSVSRHHFQIKEDSKFNNCIVFHYKPIK